MIAIVGKLFSWPEVRGLPYYSIALHHEDFLRIVLSDNPLPSTNADTLRGLITNFDEIDKGVRPILRMIQTGHVNDVVNLYAQSIKFFEMWVHRAEP
tara:strand:+ start:65 stop:355 length:291 start_codon:yes stop_codon:yes gene_type:complete